MKVSTNWLQEYANGVKILPDGGVDELVVRIGAQLGAVEEVIDVGGKYQGIVIVRVVSCEKHKDADKLHVCMVDDGGVVKKVPRDNNGHVQVVCGAPNVHEGMSAVWLPPGTTVPSSPQHEPLVLEARAIRGVVSNGMLASPSELDINDDHDGILEIDEKVKPGDDFAKTFGLDDYVIDIENKMFTHRPDLFGILGVAREIAGITQQSFKSPDWYMDSPRFGKAKAQLPLKITNDAPKLAPRVMAVAIDGINIGSSPLWMRTALKRVGIRSINNIVDISNYMMHLTSQPMHAFDYHKVKKLSGTIPTLGPRLAEDGEVLTLLGNKKISLTKDDIVIATDKKAIDLAGVMGGLDTEVDASTTAIILTICSFDMYAVRRSTMRHGVFTDAATRYTKDQSPLQNDRVLLKSMEMIGQYADGRQASEVFDVKNGLRPPVAVHVTAGFIQARLGLTLDIKTMARLLENVEFKVSVNGPTLAVTPPFWRTDIEIPEDIVEEVGRLYGYDHLPLVLPGRDLTPPGRNQSLAVKQRIREVLARAGANELLTYSFVHGGLLDKTGQDRAQAYELSNALSPDLQYYRMSLTPSLLDKVHPNVKAGYERFTIFEIGKGHNIAQTDEKDNGLPQEFQMLAAVCVVGDKKADTRCGAAFYDARRYLDYLAHELGLTLRYAPIEKEEPYQVAKPFDFRRSASVWAGDIPLGMVGEYRASVAKQLKLPRHTAGFEIGIEQILAGMRQDKAYVTLSRFPKVEQDISLKVPIGTTYQTVYDLLAAQLLGKSGLRTSLIPLDIYQDKQDSKYRHMTFRFTVASYEKTLKNEEVNAMLDKAAAAARAKLHAERL